MLTTLGARTARTSMRQVPKFSGLAVAAVLAALAAIPIVVRLGTAASTAIPILVAIVSLVAPAILTYSQRTGEVAARPDDPREAEAEPSFAARRARCGLKPDESLSVLGVVPQGLPPGAAALWKDPRAVAGLIPLARAGTPEEAAGGVLLLASPFATYITGHTLEVTGGMGI